MSALAKAGRVARNVAGLLLILLGLVLWLTPVLPGGALLIPGLLLVNFPGKRRLLLRLERTRPVSRLLAQNPRLARIWERL